MKGTVSAKKAFQGSKREARELKEGTEENNVLTDEGSLICPPGKSVIFEKKSKQNKLFIGQTCYYN